MKEDRKLLIFYDYFYPGYKAGGPIQSLTNLAAALGNLYDIAVITTAYDLNTQLPYPGIEINNWNKVKLPGSAKAIKIFYSDYKSLNKKSLSNLIKETHPDIIYLNGIFSYQLFLLPLLTLRNLAKISKIIVCPRGMLKEGALASKAFKKKVYLLFLKILGIMNKAYWHATTQEEASNIKKHFQHNKGITVAPNIPKKPFSNITFLGKKAGEIKFVYLSLINEHKNVLLLLQLIQLLPSNIFLDIYGPVVDKRYWQQCQSLIQQMPGKVQYKGEVQPAGVQQVLAQYHALILLTKGENFGHALYESLSVGRPVITSFFTPWNDLQQNRAGVNVDISNAADCITKINSFADMNQHEYDTYCNGAHHLALQYYKNLDTEEKYRKLFG